MFDGRQGHYREDDPVNPLSVYAETKAQAERIVLANPRHTVIRTSLNGGTSPTGDRGFNEEMRRAWRQGQTLTLFDDEFRCPIPALVTARAIWEFVDRRATGLWHLAGAERLSRWEIGQTLAARWPQLHPQLRRASLHEYSGAPRPPDTSLDCTRAQSFLSFPLPAFRAWLAAPPDLVFSSTNPNPNPNPMTPIPHAPFPKLRPRRLRQTATLRRFVAETQLTAHSLVLPFFVRPGRKLRRPVASMPGVDQLSPDEVLRDATEAATLGVPAVLLFGIPDRKDERASGAYARQGIVQQAVRLLKKELPDLLVITDVCLCEYMSHGHCGLVQRNPRGARILNDPTLKLLARAALSHAEAGADLVAPSDMMDGRVAAIRSELDRHGFQDTPILSYAAKFASAFYGPFRDAAESAPHFGDRRSYQMDPPNALEALREVALDLQEGADLVMVKPALAYLDVIHRVKSTFGFPTAAYSVSAEYSMIKAAAAQGWVDERAVTLESLLAMRRAGADILITYAARDVARWLRQTP